MIIIGIFRGGRTVQITRTFYGGKLSRDPVYWARTRHVINESIPSAHCSELSAPLPHSLLSIGREGGREIRKTLLIAQNQPSTKKCTSNLLFTKCTKNDCLIWWAATTLESLANPRKVRREVEGFAWVVMAVAVLSNPVVVTPPQATCSSSSSSSSLLFRPLPGTRVRARLSTRRWLIPHLSHNR